MAPAPCQLELDLSGLSPHTEGGSSADGVGLNRLPVVDGETGPSSVPDLASYDRVLVMMSGGKDSVACLLHLLERGVPPERVELWHHLVDGREGSGLMDWPFVEDYVRKLGGSFEVPVYFSWKTGGFEREMLREEQRTASIRFETPSGNVLEAGGTNGTLGTRRKFPQVSASLTTRWCSAYLKIDVADAALRGQERFRGSRTLVVTGERAEESAARARYALFEPHRADLRDGTRYIRHIDHWRPVHGWSEERVWEILERWRVNPAPPYRLGWGRLSCSACIFGSADQWASLRVVRPEQFEKIVRFEDEFGVTIHRTKSVRELAAEGTPYPAMNPADIAAARAETFDEPIRLEPGEWALPAGAFGDSAGPT